MRISALEGITITDSDIDEIEKLFGDVTFDEPRRKIIRSLESFDVQAFPGSGKTTVLIAKLAILAKKWPYANKGICVLSHTNVARDEIEQRLGKTDIGKRLLSYPHFIGTLHSFCDTYISIPWLRSRGYPISLIDTDLVLKKRWDKLSYGTKSFLEKTKKSEYACESIQYPVAISIGCKDTSPSYKNVQQIIQQSQQDGYFTFNEMLHIANYVLSECRTVCIATQKRFPILFIDEAQDTSAAQWKLINAAFCDAKTSIRQAFGDANQAIFQSYNNKENSSIFPNRAKMMTIPDSHRFGPAIAKLADSLAVSQHGLVGDGKLFKKNDQLHTIFLFDKANPQTVLQAYAKHILTCFSEDEVKQNTRLGCYVVGMVHNTAPESTNSPHYPVGIRDYYLNYDPDVSKSKPKPTHLITYFRIGLEALGSTHNYSCFLESVSSAFLRIINHNSANSIFPSAKAFNALLLSLPSECHSEFRKAMLNIVMQPFSTQQEWLKVRKKCMEILRRFFGVISFSPLQPDWIIPDNAPTEHDAQVTKSPPNTFIFKDENSGRSIDIHLASIHSVKGQTHLATMVVETYWYDSNIKSLLPWLYNDPPKKMGQRIITRMKCHYVALTRARGLICIALPKDFVTGPDIKLLNQNGWNIIYI